MSIPIEIRPDSSPDLPYNFSSGWSGSAMVIRQPVVILPIRRQSRAVLLEAIEEGLDAVACLEGLACVR